MNKMIQPVAQTVTVSSKTLDVLQFDLRFFDSNATQLNQNKLLNLIVQNYSGVSPADFKIRQSRSTDTEQLVKKCSESIVKEIRQEIRRTFGAVSKYKEQQLNGELKKISAKITREVIENTYKQDFFTKQNQPVHGTQIRFTLTAKSVKKLLTIPDIPHDKLTPVPFAAPEKITGYKKLVKYLARLFEAYAKLPINERERILFHDSFQMIQDAIERNCCLTVTNDDIKKIFIKPYGVLADNATGFQYLIGYSAENNPKARFKLATFRIYRLFNLSLSQETEPLNHAEKARLEDWLSRVSPAYFATDAITVKVLLNKAGKHKLDIILHGKPTPSQIIPAQNGWDEYVFFCSEFQAKTYFFKLGADAVITEPHALRMEMRRMFLKAAENYRKPRLNE